MGVASFRVRQDGRICGQGALWLPDSAVDYAGDELAYDGGGPKQLWLWRALRPLRRKKVVQVWARRCHALLLLAGGGVMAFGRGWQGRLGHGDEDCDLDTPTPIGRCGARRCCRYRPVPLVLLVASPPNTTQQRL